MNTIRNDIYPENVSGEFCVNDQCIICDMCFEIAPEVFRACDDGSQSIVYRQPVDSVGRQQSIDAMNACPVEAIERRDD